MTPKHILVTRPRSQAAPLCAALRAKGFPVTHVSVMEIAPLDAPDSIAQIEKQFLQIAHIDALVFVSVNAAQMALPWLERFPPASSTQLLAVGKTTAQFLDHHFPYATTAQPRTLFPHREMNSEGLLALPALQESRVRGKRFLILRGEGGRERIADTLETRGAQVDSVVLYRRFVPMENAAALQQALARCDTILINSAESLDNLLVLSSTRDSTSSRTAPLGKTLVVPGQRVAQIARERGFTQLLIAENATDEAVVEVVCRR